ncbi:tRNA epoxyqueuosine(34) reductase QueG [Parvibium lacunae]
MKMDESAKKQLVQQISTWANALGFADLRIGPARIDPAAQARLASWLAAGYHGKMDYMARHEALRRDPTQLHPQTLRVISLRMNYLPASTTDNWVDQAWETLNRPGQAYVSLYARGRDYHKVLRQRLQQLANQIQQQVAVDFPDMDYRVFTDSAPVMEVELGQQAGLGWRGKHTLLLTREAGSMFFLGEIFTNLDLPMDSPTAPEAMHCGTCRRCLDVCPTQAIVAPYSLDARRCISYLTIENKGAIPVELRPLMGNRIYGCDDCQLICPWNKFAQRAPINDFDVRNGLDSASLVALFAWTEREFNERLQGSPIRRIGYGPWLRNIAVALGNALRDSASHQAAIMIEALQAKVDDPDPLVREHVAWALAQQPSGAT